MILLSTLTLAIAAINPTGDSEYDTTLNLGERHYIQAAAAGSEGSWYFKPGIAFNVVDDIVCDFTSLGLGVVNFEFATSTSLSLGFGVHVAENLRLEFGYFESENDISVLGVDQGVTLDQEIISFMGLLDFDTDGEWTPYVGVGVAMMDAKLTGAVTTTGDDDTLLIFCAGIDVALSDNMDFTAEYRLASPTYENLDGSNVDVDNGTIFLGLNWAF